MKVLKTFEFPEAAVRSGKHDWATLTDGNIRELTEGVDFAGRKKWFAVSCRIQAKKRNLRVRLAGHNDESNKKLVVQFFDPNAEQQEQQQAPQQQAPAKGKK